MLNYENKSRLLLMFFLFFNISFQFMGSNSTVLRAVNTAIQLPNPILESDFSVEKAILKRRSVRQYNHDWINLQELSQLLWSAQGITESSRNLRAAPSAGALYPLTVYVYANRVEKLDVGFYYYCPHENELRVFKKGDYLSDIQTAGLNQRCLQNPAAVIIITGDLDIIEPRYRDRALMYTHIEVGHVGQNIHLQAIPLDIGTVVVGAMNERIIEDLLEFTGRKKVFTMMPLGKVK